MKTRYEFGIYLKSVLIRYVGRYKIGNNYDRVNIKYLLVKFYDSSIQRNVNLFSFQPDESI